MNTSEPFQGTITSIQLEIDKTAYDGIIIQETTPPPTILNRDGCSLEWAPCFCSRPIRSWQDLSFPNIGNCRYDPHNPGLYCNCIFL